MSIYIKRDEVLDSFSTEMRRINADYLEGGMDVQELLEDIEVSIRPVIYNLAYQERKEISWSAEDVLDASTDTGTVFANEAAADVWLRLHWRSFREIMVSYGNEVLHEMLQYNDY